MFNDLVLVGGYNNTILLPPLISPRIAFPPSSVIDSELLFSCSSSSSRALGLLPLSGYHSTRHAKLFAIVAEIRIISSLEDNYVNHHYPRPSLPRHHHQKCSVQSVQRNYVDGIIMRKCRQFVKVKFFLAPLSLASCHSGVVL